MFHDFGFISLILVTFGTGKNIISHEFRTPLTLIMGPLEQILSESPGKEMEARANLMMRNSRRLLNLINQLLELAKFESGKMQLEASLQDIVPFVKNIVMCFESLALQKKVELVFQGQEDHIKVYFDPEKKGDRLIPVFPLFISLDPFDFTRVFQ